MTTTTVSPNARDRDSKGILISTDQALGPIFVSVKQAAEILGIKPWACYQLCDEQRIESRYQGRRRLVSVKSLHEYAAGLPTTAPAASTVDATCPAWCAEHTGGSDGGYHDSTDKALATAGGNWLLFISSGTLDGQTLINLAHVGGEPFVTPPEARALAKALTEAADAVEQDRPL